MSTANSARSSPESLFIRRRARYTTVASLRRTSDRMCDVLPKKEDAHMEPHLQELMAGDQGR
jgi:hypothetical protein